METGGGVVAGVQNLPSTSTDGNAQTPLAYLGIAFIAMGAVMLVRQRPRQTFTQ
jgi:hypothetical protein